MTGLAAYLWMSFFLKPGQNKKGQKTFQLHRFLNTFLQQAAEKKYSKNGAAGNFFGPSSFVTDLVKEKKKERKKKLLLLNRLYFAFPLLMNNFY